jgi:hypothetical protein
VDPGPGPVRRARFERYRFGDGGRAQPTAHEDGRHAYINHAQKGDANKLEHYLERTTADGRGGQHSYFTVSMNLPQADAPPVAFETAVPGEAFFVPKGATFRRRSASSSTPRWTRGTMRSGSTATSARTAPAASASPTPPAAAGCPCESWSGADRAGGAVRRAVSAGSYRPQLSRSLEVMAS